MKQHDGKTWCDKASTLSKTHPLAYYQEPTVIHKNIDIYSPNCDSLSGTRSCHTSLQPTVALLPVFHSLGD